MKKLYFILSFLVLLTGCQEKNQDLKVSEENPKDQVEEKIENVEEVPDEKNLGTIGLKKGSDLEYSSLDLQVFSKEGDFISLALEEKSKALLISLLESLEEVENREEDQFSADLDEDSLRLELGEDAYLLFPDSSEYEGYYHCSYFKDGKVQRLFRSEKNLNKDLIEAVVLGELLDQGKISKEVEDPKYGDIKINSFSPVAKFFEGDKVSIVGYLEIYYYSLDQGIFENSGGSGDPCQVTYALDQDEYKFSSFKTGAMGDYETNLRNFSRGIEDLAIALSSERRPMDQILERLYFQAKDQGLKDFTFDLGKIPGYEEDVVYIENTKEVPKDSVLIAKKDAYEDALSRLGAENWTYVDGLIYYKPYGLALKTIIDDFEEIK